MQSPQEKFSRRVQVGAMTQEDADLVSLYCEERRATDHIQETTTTIIIKSLISVVPDLAPFKECTTPQVIKMVNATESRWSQNTRRLRIVILKKFLRWLITEGYNTTLNLQKVDSIKPPSGNKITKSADKMISSATVDEMIRSCKNSRDRALIALAFEGALRPSEARNATWNQLSFDEYGAKFITSGKTGKTRYIRIIRYAGYLTAWQADYHPGTPTGDALIFPTRSGKILSENYYTFLVTEAAKAAGLEGFFPYLLRHSRITEMISEKIPESVVKLQAWGSLSTPMLATYAHVSNDQQDDILLASAGVKRVGRPAGPTIKPAQCGHCQTINVPGSSFCRTCGRSLTEKAESEVDQIREIMKNPGMLRLLADELEKQTKTG
jgi:integrase